MLVRCVLDLFDVGADLGEGPRGVGHRLPHLRIASGATQVAGVETDAQSGHPLRQGGGEVRRFIRKRAVLRILGWPRQHVEEDRGVPHVPGHGADRRIVEDAEGVLVGVPAGDAALGSLDAVDARQRGRDADRAAAVRALGDGGDARRHRRRGTAAGASGSARGVPGVARRPEHPVLGGAVVPVLWGVGLADDDPAAGTHAVGAHCVRRCDSVIHQRPLGEAHAGDGLQVLDRHRHPVQGTQLTALHHRLLGGVGLAHGVVGHHGHEGAECIVEPFDPVERELHQLDRRKSPGGDQVTQHVCRRVGKVRAGLRHGNRPPSHGFLGA